MPQSWLLFPTPLHSRDVVFSPPSAFFFFFFFGGGGGGGGVHPGPVSGVMRWKTDELRVNHGCTGSPWRA